VNDMDRIQCATYARLPVFTRRVERAQAIVAEALATMRRPYMAFSGGVDSTVVLDLVLAQAPDTPILWGDDGYDLPDTLAFLRRVEDERWVNIQRIRCLGPWRDWCEEMGRPDLADDPAARAAWGNPPIWQATTTDLKTYAPQVGYDGVFLGLLGTARKAGGESRARSLALRGGARPLYQVAREGGVWHCSPLASWGKQDVWGYIISRGLAYNTAYDTLARLGVPLERRRVAPLTTYRVAHYGMFTYIRAGWPDTFNRFATIFPSVRQYS